MKPNTGLVSGNVLWNHFQLFHLNVEVWSTAPRGAFSYVWQPLKWGSWWFIFPFQAQNSRQWTIRWNVFSGLFEVGDPHREISCHIKPLFRVCCWAAVRKWNVCVIMASHSIYTTWSLCLLLFGPHHLIYCNHNETYGAEYYEFWWK